tara:strand:- start:490 stop:1527 length:1038 start_codon:yes stop_codon:yes gene_type:complete
MKKVIVTGGAGFIGSNLVKYLLNKKYFVINIDNLSYSANPYNLKNINNYKTYKFYKLDINNQKEILKILKKFNPIAIFNLAAETHVDRSIDNPEKFIKSNILGVFNLIEVVKKYIKTKKKKMKFIHISTDEVYGDIKFPKRSGEKHPYSPSSPYSSSKASADHLIKSYIRTYNFPAIITNCCNNYGPNQFPEKLIPKLIYNIIKNKPLPIYGKGKNSREWIYVEDHCEALLKILMKGKLGESYNIGSNQNFRNIDLVKKLLFILKKSQIKRGKKAKVKFVKDRPGHDVRYALNSSKINKQLNWKAKTSLEVGLANTFLWYIKNINFFSSVSKKLYDKRLGLNLND